MGRRVVHWTSDRECLSEISRAGKTHRRLRQVCLRGDEENLRLATPVLPTRFSSPRHRSPVSKTKTKRDLLLQSWEVVPACP